METDAKKNARLIATTLTNMTRPPLRPLPSLDDTWSHWAIFGDDQRLDVVAEDDVARALRIIEENRDRYAAIFVHRARSSAAGDLEVQKRSDIRSLADSEHMSTVSGLTQRLQATVAVFCSNIAEAAPEPQR